MSQQISMSQAVGRTVSKVEQLPSMLKISYIEDGVAGSLLLPIEGSLNDVQLRIGKLIEAYKRHRSMSQALAHTMTSTESPTQII